MSLHLFLRLLPASLPVFSLLLSSPPPSSEAPPAVPATGVACLPGPLQGTGA